MITKLNTCLLVVAFLSALVLMQLEQAKLINISNIKEKARALGMRLPDPTNKQALKSE